MTDRTHYSIRAVDRVCNLLDALQEALDGVSLTSLTDRVNMPKPSVLRYLSALEARQYVEWNPEAGNYRLGPALRPGRAVYLERLREAALPHLLTLREMFDETVNLGVLDGREVVHVEVAECRQNVRLAARRGDRAEAHATAVGKATATLLSKPTLDQLLSRRPMKSITPRTITDPETFRIEVGRTAKRGYGIDDCENQPDGRCVAVAIEGLAVPAAVSVSAPAARLSVGDVPGVARRLKRNLPPLASALRAVPVPQPWPTGPTGPHPNPPRANNAHRGGASS